MLQVSKSLSWIILFTTTLDLASFRCTEQFRVWALLLLGRVLRLLVWCRVRGTNGSRHPLHRQGRDINPSAAMRCPCKVQVFVETAWPLYFR